jgi:hypothetical protein
MYSLINQCLNIAQVLVIILLIELVQYFKLRLFSICQVELRYIAITSDMSARYN